MVVLIHCTKELEKELEKERKKEKRKERTKERKKERKNERKKERAQMKAPRGSISFHRKASMSRNQIQPRSSYSLIYFWSAVDATPSYPLGARPRQRGTEIPSRPFAAAEATAAATCHDKRIGKGTSSCPSSVE